MRQVFHVLCFVIISSLINACMSLGQNKETTKPDERITRRSLVRSTYQSENYYVVYAAENEAKKEDLFKALQNYLKASDRVNLKLLSEDKVESKLIQSSPLLLVGVHHESKLLKKLGKKLPIQSIDKHFSFNDKVYDNDDDIFLLSYYPNPENQGFPISVITGNTQGAITSFLEQRQDVFSFGRWGFEHYQNNQRRLMGNFNDRLPQWRIDSSSVFKFATPVILSAEVKDISLKVHDKSISKNTVSAIVNQIDRNRHHFMQLFGISELPIINYELFVDGEQKGLMTGNTDATHVDFAQQTALVAISPDLKGTQENPEVMLWTRTALGNTSFPILETGLSLYFSENWHDKGYLYWFSLLAKSQNNFTVKNILSNDGLEDPSRLVNKAVGAAFSYFLIEEKGVGYFKRIYKGDYVESEIEALEIAWGEWKNALSFQYEENRYLLKDFYWKGFNFTHEGYQVYNGYLSKQAEASLDRLKSLGSNSITLVPYSYMRNPNKPTVLPIPQNAGSENDASIMHSIYHAHKKGLKVLLKPQVWIGRNSWPGDVEMQSEGDWDKFFENYYKWIRHYALMASMYQVEALCLGVEFSKATIQHPEKWVEIIKEIRKVYHGSITYSANWGEEFEQLTFWDELDYIGISHYYPLTKENSPSDRELIKGFEKNLNKLANVAKKHDKTILLTEIGFRSISAPWIQPHDYPGEQEADEIGQNRCYKIVFGCLQNKSWCKGMFWWKWPTTFDRTSADDKRFTPYNKAAEKTVKKWYSKL